MNAALILHIAIILTVILGGIIGELFFFRTSVFCVLALCFLNANREVKIVNPYSLFAMVPFSLLIYANVGDFYMQDLTASTWILAIINMWSFLIGLRVASNDVNPYICVGVGLTFEEYRNHAMLLTIVGTIPYLYYAITKAIFPLASIFTLFSIPGLVCAIASKNRWLIIFCLGVMLSPMVIGHTSKTSVLTIALCFAIAYEKFYIKSSFGRKKMIIIGILGVILMIFSFTFANKNRGVYDSEEGFKYYDKAGVVWNHDVSLFLPYMYLTTPWTNLQHVIQTQDTRSYGLWLFKPLLGYMQIDDNFKELYEIKAYSNFKTFTFIAVQFKDFGFWGSTLISLLLGLYVKKIYSIYIISKSPLDVATFVYVGQAVMEMFFSNHFFVLSYPFTIFILMFLYKKTVCFQNAAVIDV